MPFILMFIVLHFVFPQPVHSYDQDVTTWQDVKRSGEPGSRSRFVWANAANRSDYEWKVFKENHTVKAALRTEDEKKEALPFAPQAENFKNAYASLRVDDGWLIAFNEGEFGAALYWFDPSGHASHKISDHQVVAFFPSSDGILAIEGLAHLSLSYGSLIQLRKGSQWQAEKLTLLPEAPYAGVQFRDGRLLLVLSDSLAKYVKKENRERLEFVVKDGGWAGLYPNSVVLTDDETRVYIGMRQFVAEYEFKRRTLRFLVPDSSLLNKLPAKEERAIMCPTC
jgi:hypothetical protein